MSESLREKEVILLALDFYHRTRTGTAGADEAKALAVKIRTTPPTLEQAGELQASKPAAGKWISVRSSGYDGYRCEVCATFVYADNERKCRCDPGAEAYSD